MARDKKTEPAARKPLKQERAAARGLARSASERYTVSGHLRRLLMRQVESGKPLLQLAREAGVSQSTLFRFITEKKTLTLDVVDRLCEFFGLELRGRLGD